MKNFSRFQVFIRFFAGTRLAASFFFTVRWEKKSGRRRRRPLSSSGKVLFDSPVASATSPEIVSVMDAVHFAQRFRTVQETLDLRDIIEQIFVMPSIKISVISWFPAISPARNSIQLVKLPDRVFFDIDQTDLVAYVVHQRRALFCIPRRPCPLLPPCSPDPPRLSFAGAFESHDRFNHCRKSSPMI